MTINEKIETVKTLYGDEFDDTTVEAYLGLAESKALTRLYPYGEGEMPEKYDFTICELAVRLISRRGGEGEIQPSENGVARIYKDTTAEDLLARFVPIAKVV